MCAQSVRGGAVDHCFTVLTFPLPSVDTRPNDGKLVYTDRSISDLSSGVCGAPGDVGDVRADWFGDDRRGNDANGLSASCFVSRCGGCDR